MHSRPPIYFALQEALLKGQMYGYIQELCMSHFLCNNLERQAEYLEGQSCTN